MPAHPGDDVAAPDLTWSAQLLDPREEADAQRIQQLRDDPAVQVLDHIDGQWAELRDMLPTPPRDALDEPTRWAWYPWRRTLTHVLGPVGYRRVRLDRNRNKITRDEQDALGRQAIGIVGLSVGHAIAHTLALQGIAGVLRLADFDAIEISNLNRIPATVFDLGVNKAVVVGRRIAELDPYLRVEVITEGLTEQTMAQFVDGLDIVIEECDSLDMKLRVREAARAAGIALIMETSDRGLLDVERFDQEPDRPLFHGLLGATTAADLRGLSTHDKVPHVLRILEPAELSARMAASMTEVDVTVSTWPQLGGDITLGAASVAAAVTRIGRGSPLASGRARIDLEAILDSIADPAPAGARPDGTGASAGSVPAEPGSDAAAADGTPGWLVVPSEPRRAVAHAANIAPSGGNTQPWLLALSDDQLEIAVDPQQTSRMDVAYRGSYVAIGAALFNARVTAAANGVLGEAIVDAPPGAGAGDPLARARLAFGSGADAELAALRPLVLSRQTNRRFGDGQPISDDALAAMRAAARAEGGDLTVIAGAAPLRAVAELIGESDRLRYLSAAMHAEMMRELRWPGVDDLSWGLDVRTLELDESDLAKLQVARRADVMAYLDRWGVGRALGDASRDRIASSGAVAIVTTAGREPADYVRGGQALERMWMAAQEAGVGVHPVSPVFLYAHSAEDFADLSESHSADLAQLSEQFRSLMGISHADSSVLVLRLSNAAPATLRSGRQPLDRVLDVRTGQSAM